MDPPGPSPEDPPLNWLTSIHEPLRVWTPFTRAKISTGQGLNHFGTALPIYTTQNKRFFASWARFQFLIGTPSPHLFYSREMVDKQLAVILHRISRVKSDLNRNRKSHLRFNKKIDRHFGQIRKKGRKEKRLFAANAHVASQNFRERSLWVRSSNQAWFDMADTDRRHFCDNHALWQNHNKRGLKRQRRAFTRKNYLTRCLVHPCRDYLRVSASLRFWAAVPH